MIMHRCRSEALFPVSKTGLRSGTDVPSWVT
ncbi:MAG: hypothetical protein QG622_1604 [Actinomycetota bacterium]|nr:hypothetical protein [Actinomycetota bacterium]